MKFINYPQRAKNAWMFLYKIGALTGCHQLPERSFKLFDLQFPVCARCTGVVLGQITHVILVLTHKSINIQFSLLFLSIMFIDWLLQRVKIKHSTNFRRFITGIMGGIGLIGVYVFIFKLIF